MAAATDSLLAFALGLSLTAALTIRGLRVSVVADQSEIVVRNWFRTYRVQWENLSHVFVSVTTSIGSSFSAIVFKEKGGRFVAAQATTVGGREQGRVMHELAKLRPELPIQFSE